MAAEQDLLNILQAQGLQFLDSFSLPNSNQKKRKRGGDHDKRKDKVSKVDQDKEFEEEWLGFSGPLRAESSSSEESGGEDHDEGRPMNASYLP
jgi:hypothetical protein